MTASNAVEIADPADHARALLDKARERLAAGRLHGASSRGWRAAEHMAKAVARAQGWEYTRIDEFNLVIERARRLSGNDRMHLLRGFAGELRRNESVRKRYLDAEAMSYDLERVAELVELLAPLTRRD